MLLRAGIPLSEAPALLQEDLSAGALAQVAGELAAELGVTTFVFSEAMEHCGAFPPYAVNTVRVGEVSGRQEESFFALCAYYRREDALQRQIKSAVLGPAILVAMMAAVLFVTVLWILPVLAEAFAKLGLAMTGGLGLALAAGRGAMVLTAAALLAVLFVAVRVLSGDSESRERFLAKLPGFSAAARAGAVARFTGALTAFLQSGMLPSDALDQAVELAGSPLYAEGYAACRKAMEEGKDLAAALVDSGMLDGLESRILLSASRAGQLDQAMDRVSDLYAQRAEDGTQRMLGVVEPLLVGLLTAAVGIILLAVMLPLIQMMSAIG